MNTNLQDTSLPPNLPPQLYQKVRIGDWLVQKNIITEQQLEQALAEQKSTGMKLGNALVSLGIIDEESLLKFLSEQLKIPYIRLDRIKIPAETATQLSEAIARRLRVVLLEISERDAFVGMADPTQILAIDELQRHLKRRIKIAVVKESELLVSLDLLYKKSSQISSLVEQLDDQLSQSDVDLDNILEGIEASDTPVFRLLKTLFEEAVLQGASDIHIEPGEKVLLIRQRVDGILHERVMNEIRIAPALIQRLKLLAQLDIAEKRLPQDGRFQIKVKRHNIDVRLSSMPTQYGESVVMRLADTTAGIPKLAQLKMPELLASRWQRLIKNPHGLLLVTGPTGSGKTTTLYATLQELNTADRKIISVEDPVEMQLYRVNQVQVQPKIDLTFSRVLRTALRQDPDVILIGEMRDLETAEIALRASMTGHLVFSTLHTNGAVATIARLMDMGIEGFLLAASLSGVIGQRLIRKNCPHCKTEVALSERHQVWLRAAREHFNLPEGQMFQGQGCERCHDTGYRGRRAVQELLVVDGEIAEAIRQNDQRRLTEIATSREDFVSLTEAAYQVALDGDTSLDEVIRMGGDEGSWN